MIHYESFSRTDRRIYFYNHNDPVEQIAFFLIKIEYKSFSSWELCAKYYFSNFHSWKKYLSKMKTRMALSENFKKLSKNKF